MRYDEVFIFVFMNAYNQSLVKGDPERSATSLNLYLYIPMLTVEYVMDAILVIHVYAQACVHILMFTQH